MKNNELLIKLFNERNIKHSTKRGYVTSLKSYTSFCNMSLNELLFEAFEDENDNTFVKDRKIKQHLMEYRVFLINNNIATSTIKNYLSKVKTFYKHYEIEVPDLPPIKYKKDYEICYDDLPTKKDIEKVLDVVSLDFKALILFMSSSGTAKAETLSLTIKDFYNATSDYHSSSTVTGFLYELSNKTDIVPTFYIKRFKTDKYYYTFCSSEATDFIVKYLKSRDDLSFEDKLFPFTDSMVIKKFEHVNDYMNWGFKGNYRFFRSHTLRKFHASNIGLPAEYVDALQGRSKNKIHETYIKTNPKELKNKYMKNMKYVMIYSNKNKEKEDNENIYININIFVGDTHINL